MLEFTLQGRLWKTIKGSVAKKYEINTMK